MSWVETWFLLLGGVDFLEEGPDVTGDDLGLCLASKYSDGDFMALSMVTSESGGRRRTSAHDLRSMNDWVGIFSRAMVWFEEVLAVARFDGVLQVETIVFSSRV